MRGRSSANFLSTAPKTAPTHAVCRAGRGVLRVTLTFTEPGSPSSIASCQDVRQFLQTALYLCSEIELAHNDFCKVAFINRFALKADPVSSVLVSYEMPSRSRIICCAASIRWGSLNTEEPELLIRIQRGKCSFLPKCIPSFDLVQASTDSRKVTTEIV